MDINLKAQSYCMAKDIKIYIVPIKGLKDVYIEVNIQGVKHNSQKTYRNQKIASEKIWELYEYFYKKQNNF